MKCATCGWEGNLPFCRTCDLELDDVSGPVETHPDGAFAESTGEFLAQVSGEGECVLTPAPVLSDSQLASMLMDNAVLAFRAGLGVPKEALSAFEQHVAQFIDGKRPVARICRKSGLAANDVRIAIGMMANSRVLHLVGTATRKPTRVAVSAPVSARSVTRSVVAPAKPTGYLAREGELTNPTTAAGILALPLVKIPSDAELSQMSVPVLLRLLRAGMGTQRVDVTADGHPVFTLVVVDGREVRTSASLATLGKALSLPQMTYRVTELGRPPQMATVARTHHLIVEAVRGLCAQCSIEDLVAAFPRREGRCPRAKLDVAATLGLPPQHQRFIKSELDGTRFLDEIARAAVGARTVWETLYALELHSGLSWDEAPAGRVSSTQTSDVESGASFGDTAAPFDGKDFFQVLGLHWSSAPSEITPAYERVHAEYMNGGMKRPSSDVVAEKCLRIIDDARRVLSSATARSAYRRSKYNLVWSHQAQLLVQKAKLAIYRQDMSEALDLLTVAEEVFASVEGRALLARLVKKRDTQQ